MKSFAETGLSHGADEKTTPMVTPKSGTGLTLKRVTTFSA